MVGASHRLRALQRGVGPLFGKVATAYAKAVQAGIVRGCSAKNGHNLTIRGWHRLSYD